MDGDRSKEHARRDAPDPAPAYDLPWADRLKHRRDPNRVPGVQAPPPADPLAAAQPRASDVAAGAPPAAPHPPAASPPAAAAGPAEPSYYDVPMLKKPPWRWEIAGYFFLGGLSAGAHVIGRVAEIFGGGRYRRLTRASTAVAALAAVPCAPLLIHDLGDPKRFHHMLRVWKPSSPMNLGTWTVTAFNGAVAVALLREWARGRGRSRDERTTLGRIAEWVRRTDGSVITVTGAVGIPLGLLMAGYTGVLLSNTSTPIWSQNPWLGALFSASAIGSGAAATSLAMDVTGAGPRRGRGGRRGREDGNDGDDSHTALGKIETAAHVAQAVTLAGYLRHAGPLARPLLHGPMRKHLRASIGGLVVSELLRLIPFRGRRRRRRAGRLAAAISLLSGFCLRWAIAHAGRDSAADPAAARRASRGTAGRSTRSTPLRRAGPDTTVRPPG